jgi:hypothetical protein
MKEANTGIPAGLESTCETYGQGFMEDHFYKDKKVTN